MTTRTATDLIRGLLDAQPSEEDAAERIEETPTQTQVSEPQSSVNNSNPDANLAQQTTVAPMTSDSSHSSVDDTTAEISEADPEPPPITHHEREFVLRVAPLAGRSPRAAKRFVNVYRLIRSALRPEDIDTFVDERNGGYRPALILLAIVVGVPNVAVEFFAHVLALGDDERLSDIAAGITVGNAKDNSTAEEWRRMRTFLVAVAATPNQNFSVADLRTQIQRVGRYSFQLGRF